MRFLPYGYKCHTSPLFRFDHYDQIRECFNQFPGPDIFTVLHNKRTSTRVKTAPELGVQHFQGEGRVELEKT